MKLTNEQFEQLSPLDKVFESVIYAQTIKGTTAKEDEMVRVIYSEVTKLVYNLNRSCSSCVFSLYKRMAHIYFADKEERANAPVAEVEQKQKENGKRKKNGHRGA